MDQMEAAQRELIDAQRRWNADEKGDTSSCWRFVVMRSSA
jgi:hypothetical protein